MRPKRTQQIVGIVVGALLLLLSPTLAFFGMTIAFALFGDPGSGRYPLQWMINAGIVGSAFSIIGLIILVIAIVSFVRAGRTGPRP